MRMKILHQMETVRELFSKMQESDTLKLGVITGITLQIPQWIYSRTFTIQHIVLTAMLIGVLTLDFIVGFYLAKQSPKMKRGSTTLFNAFVKNFVIISICAMAYGMDYLLGTYTFIFSFLTAAFILQNAYSLAGNIYVVGWTKHYPTWLFEWARDEIELKKEKYFPKTEKEEDSSH